MLVVFQALLMVVGCILIVGAARNRAALERSKRKPMKGVLHHGAVPAIPPLVGLSFLIAAYVGDSIVGLDAFDVTAMGIALGPPGESEIGWRILWAITSGMMFLAFLWAALFGALVFRRNLDHLSVPRQVVALLGVGMIAAAPVTTVITQRIGSGVSETLFAQLEAALGATVPVFGVIDALSAASALAIALIVAGLGSTLYLAPNQQVRDELPHKMREARLLLFFAAVLLALSVAHVGILFSWPSQFMSDPAEAERVRSLAVTVALGVGVMHTFLLTATFVPAGIVQQHRANQLSIAFTRDDRSGDRRKWLVNNGLDLSAFDVLVALAAFLAPLLAGVLTKLIG